MVHFVRRSWKDLNVNLSNLLQKMIQFFESKEFKNVTALETESGYQMIAGDSKHYKMENDVSVTIEGKPDDFTISLTSCKEERRFTLPLVLTQMFGGGYFLLKNFRSEEAMQKLERDFGQKIDNMIAQAQDARAQPSREKR
jgi:hypothetical protein